VLELESKVMLLQDQTLEISKHLKHAVDSLSSFVDTTNTKLTDARASINNIIEIIQTPIYDSRTDTLTKLY